jgi:hypothetical protein
MGLRYVKGLGKQTGRASRVSVAIPFLVDDFVRRSTLDEGVLERLLLGLDV